MDSEKDERPPEQPNYGQGVARSTFSPAAGPAMTVAGAAPVIALASCRAVDLAAQLPAWARSADIYAVVLRAGGGTASATMIDDATAAERLALAWRVESFTKPMVSLLDGELTSGEISASMFGTLRVAGAAYRFAVLPPGSRIPPAAGIASTLARMPHNIGLYLALTGRGIGRADALALGLITHCVAASQFDHVISALQDAQPVDPILDGLHGDPGARALMPYEDVIARCFSAEGPTAIIAALACEGGKFKQWADGVRADMARMPPLVQAALYRLITLARALDIRDSLIVTNRVAAGLSAHGSHSGNAPAEDQSDRLFTKPESGDLDLPTRAEMESGRF